MLALTGCVAGNSVTRPTSSYTTAPAHEPRPVSEKAPLAEEIVKYVLVTVYRGAQFTARHGCGCSLKDDPKEELFPAGTQVMLLRIQLTGTWAPVQGKSTTQDVTGLSLRGTRFEGRPEDAVQDVKDGPSAATRLHLGWQPSGIFDAKPWRITDSRPVSFAAAWYVPKGVSRLDLVVDIPSEGQPTELFIDLPQSVLGAGSSGGE
ncbi:MAG: hypothetical protein ACTHJI_00520 [Leifsonia sp.]